MVGVVCGATGTGEVPSAAIRAPARAARLRRRPPADPQLVLQLAEVAGGSGVDLDLLLLQLSGQLHPLVVGDAEQRLRHGHRHQRAGIDQQQLLLHTQAAHGPTLSNSAVSSGSGHHRRRGAGQGSRELD